MEIKTGISLQTKQQLSQLQVESLNILAMSMTELKDFLQNEEIENPLVEYTSGKKKQRRLPIKRRNGFTMVQTGMREGKMSCTRLRTARNHWKTL